MNFLWTAAAFLLALGPLIVFHELGHYTVARLAGVKVLRFSVGFGRPLVKWVRGRDRTEWVVSLIPFGGYVAMLDERELRDGAQIDPADLPRAFNRQHVAKRIAIVVAGPLANLLLAILLYAGVNMSRRRRAACAVRGAAGRQRGGRGRRRDAVRGHGARRRRRCGRSSTCAGGC